MTQSNSDWHDRFQADLEAMRQQMNDYFENQSRLNADLRTRQEVQQQEIQALQEASRIELQQIQAMRENLLIQTDNILSLNQVMDTRHEQMSNAVTRQAQSISALADATRALIEEFRQHRSDGHGA